MSQAGFYLPGGGSSLITSVVGGDNINVQTVGTVATVNLDTAISWPATDATQGQILLDGVTYFHGFGSNNIFVGPGAGNFTATGIQNSGYGLSALANLSSGNQNVAVGASSMSLGAVSGFGNVGCGVGALAALTSGTTNTCTGGLSGTNIDVGDSNSCYGASSGGGLTSGVENCFYGVGSGAATGSAVQQNCGYGNQTLGTTSGNRNCAYGHQAMSQNVSGDNNCAFGPDAYANNSATGEYNICIGVEAGTNYTGAESSNIIIGNNLGVLGDSNTIRIGAPGSSTGQQNACYIAGIFGTSLGTSSGPVIVDSVGQLGMGTGTATWTEVTGTSQSMAVNQGYIANNAGLVTLTLPSTAAVGTTVEVVGKGAGGWLISQNAGQTIHVVSSNTTTGVGGSVSSTVRYDCVQLICTTADTDWVAKSSMGNLTVV